MEIIYGLIIIAAVLLEGFFSGSEIAIISLNRIRLRILAEAKEKKAVIVQNMLHNPSRLLATTLIGTNIAVVVSSSFFTMLLYDSFGPSGSELMTTLILSPIILIFAELIPKAVFSQTANSMALRLGSVLKFFWSAFYPVVWFVNLFTGSILRLVSADLLAKKKNPFVTKEEIKYLIRESETQGHIDTYERSIIYKIFDMGRKNITSIMRGLDELIFAHDKDNIEDVIARARQRGYTRFPVRSESGEFIGIINILDIVHESDRSLQINRFLRPIEFVDENMHVDNALFKIKAKKQTLAIAVDFNKNPTGFFTMEDLLEEIIGEID